MDGRNCISIPRIAIVTLGLLASSAVQALSAVELTVREVRAPGVSLADAVLRLELPPDTAPRLQLTARKVSVEGAGDDFSALKLDCPNPSLDAPRFGCPAARLAMQGGPIDDVDLSARLEFHSDTGELRARGTLLSFKGLPIKLDASLHGSAWRFEAQADRAAADAARQRFGSRLGIPEDLAFEGVLSMRIAANGAEELERAAATLTADQINMTNDAGTIVSENVSMALSATVTPANGRHDVELQLESNGGQALAGPVLLDFGANPLRVNARGVWKDDAIDVGEIRIVQQQLSRILGTARLRIGESVDIERARFDIEELQMPDAYVSFLQIALAATDFGALTTSGRLTGRVDIERNQITGFETELLGLDLEDPQRGFWIRGLRGAIHWKPADGATAQRSYLQWREAGAYGFSGGESRIDFQASGDDLRLTGPARLPVFDGALAVREMAVTHITSDEMSVEFEGDIEPISMPEISRAFGWPELQGQLSGRIPRIEYRDKTLTFGGDLVADVFDGRIVGSNIRLQDPLGAWPRLFADVRLSQLDLELVTRAFAVGSITGRLEGQVLGLELFAWAPIAFDAVLQTPQDYKGTRRISARAVGNLSNIGGGGGGVVAALQSGVFSMFDEYSYDRLGIRCRLVNDVCLMGGVEKTDSGYYIVKGRGLPRIDIVGNAGRVNWPQLASQIATQMRGEGEIRIE